MDPSLAIMTKFGSQAIFDNLRDAIFVVAPQSGAIVVWNRQAEKLFGYSQADAQSLSVAALFSASGSIAMDDKIEEVASHAVDSSHPHVMLVATARHRDGTKFAAEVGLCPIVDTVRSGVFVMATIREPVPGRAELEGQLASMTRERDVGRDEIERLLRIRMERTQLLHMVAHEFATPLTALSMQVEVMRSDEPSLEQEALRKGFELLSRNIRRLQTLSMDVLDVARLEGGRLRLEPQPVDVRGLAKEVVDALRALAEGKELGLEGPADAAPIDVWADRERLYQVLSNLMSNALRLTGAGGRVVVRTASRQGRAVIEVEDTGPGFAPEDGEKLFVAFSQLDVGEVKRAGSGLGLYISKRIIEQHGGAISASSPGPGQGATFRVELPLMKGQRPPAD